jgi:hypothetical protein
MPGAVNKKDGTDHQASDRSFFFIYAEAADPMIERGEAI